MVTASKLTKKQVAIVKPNLPIVVLLFIISVSFFSLLNS
jgi:hypothetical protein